MQRNKILKLLCFVAMALFTNVINAQCAMCRAALENNEQGVQPEAVNDGIVYLMAFPYILVGVVGFVVYRMRTKAKKEAQ